MAAAFLLWTPIMFGQEAPPTPSPDRSGVTIEEVIETMPNYQVDMAASRKHKTEYVKGWSNLVVTVQ